MVDWSEGIWFASSWGFRFIYAPKERQNNQHLSLKIMFLSLCQALSWCKTSNSSWNENMKPESLSIRPISLSFPLLYFALICQCFWHTYWRHTHPFIFFYRSVMDSTRTHKSKQGGERRLVTESWRLQLWNYLTGNCYSLKTLHWLSSWT